MKRVTYEGLKVIKKKKILPERLDVLTGISCVTLSSSVSLEPWNSANSNSDLQYNLRKLDFDSSIYRFVH